MWNPKNLIEFLKWYAPIPAMPETYSFLHCAGVWPKPIKGCLTLSITHKEEENASGYDPAPVIGCGSSNPCGWTREQTYASINRPYIQEESLEYRWDVRWESAHLVKEETPTKKGKGEEENETG